MDREARVDHTDEVLLLAIQNGALAGVSQDEAEVVVVEDSTYQNDYNIIFSFSQADLDTYLEEMAEKEKEAEEAAKEAAELVAEEDEAWDAANAADGTEDADSETEPDGTAKPDDSAN